MSFSRAAVLTIVCALVTVGGSYAELNASLSLPARATLSVLTLLGVIAFGYAGFQLILALIATTGERRWSGREVSERRTGDRARKPRGS